MKRRKSYEAIQQLFEEKACAGDGAFAIAFALMELVGAQIAVVRAIQGLEPGYVQSLIDDARRGESTE